MSIRIDGTNTTANPGITGGDADTGLQFGTDEISFVTGGTNRATVESNGNFTIENGNLVLASGSGIDFSATADGSGTTTSELFDDYEEGTWTATLTGSTAAPTVAVTATGRYTKIGRSVTVSATFSFVDTTGASGQMQILGLPFTIFNDIQARSYSVMLCGNMNVTGYAVARGEFNSTVVKAFRTDGNTQDSLLIAAGANKYVGFSLTYEAA